MLPNWIELAIEARVQSVLMWQIADWNVPDTQAYERHRIASWEAAENLGYIQPDGDVPLLLSSDYDLVEAFSQGQERWHAERAAAEEAETEAAAKARINALLVARDWKGLMLPSPKDLLADLIAGEQMKVGGHILSPDEDGVWITNPYGIDCGLWQTITPDVVEAFLVDMARGVEYGPVPY